MNNDKVIETVHDQEEPDDPRDAAQETGLYGQASLHEAMGTLPVETWFFTFGMSTKLVIYNPDIAFDGDRQEGLPMSKYYVRATGTYDEARAKMTKVFGTSGWASQYSQVRFFELIRKHHYKMFLDLK
jgi:hypothetical protein